jgi:hypothetical protein
LGEGTQGFNDGAGFSASMVACPASHRTLKRWQSGSVPRGAGELDGLRQGLPQAAARPSC